MSTEKKTPISPAPIVPPSKEAVTPAGAGEKDKSKTPKKYTKAQQPFLVQKRYLAAQAAKKAEALRNPLPVSQKATPLEAGFTTIAKMVIGMVLGGLVFSSVVSKGMTGTWFWGDDLTPYIAPLGLSKYFNLQSPVNPPATGEKVFTVQELAKYDGSNGYPPYVAIQGVVYDVSAGGATYMPGGSYNFFTGKDASRAFVTGCFETHLTHDVRGLDTPMEIDGLRNWVAFFRDSEKYHRVGTVDLPYIDPASPLPGLSPPFFPMYPSLTHLLSNSKRAMQETY